MYRHTVAQVMFLAFLGVGPGCAGKRRSLEERAAETFGPGKLLIRLEPADVPARALSLCAGCAFYRATFAVPEGQEHFPPSGQLGTLVVRGETLYAIDEPRDAIDFLSDLHVAVGSEREALDRCLAFAEIVRGKVRSTVPTKPSLFKRYRDQKPEDWETAVAATETGWAVSLTVMLDKCIEKCIRYQVYVGRDGDMRLDSERIVYYYTMYE